MLINLLISILLGAISGFIASYLMNTKKDLLTNIILGVLGGVVGRGLFSLIGISSTSYIATILISVIGACFIIFLVNRFFK